MATKSLGLLTLDLVAKIGGYVGPLDKADRETKKRMNNISGYMKNVAIASAAIGTAVVAGLAVLVKSSIDTADEMSKVSKSVGVAIEDLSALRFAADLSGVGFQELSAGLNRFNRSTSEAFEGVGAGADAYKALGIEVKRTDGSLKDNYTLIEELADAFAGMQDGAQKSALAQDLFGRSGAKLIPLLNGGQAGLEAFADEAERLGLILDQETGTSSEEFNDNLARLGFVVTGLGNRIASQLVPSLADMTSTLADPDVQNGIANIATGIAGIVENTIKASAAVGNLIGQITGFGNVEEITKLERELERLQSVSGKAQWWQALVLDDANADQAFIDREVARIEKLLNDARAELKQRVEGSASSSLDSLIDTSGLFFGNLSTDGLGVDTSGIDERMKKLNEELNSEYEQMAQSLREQVALTGDVTELEKIRYAISEGSLVGINEQQQEKLEKLAAELDAINSLRKEEELRAAAELALSNDLKTVRDQLMSQEDQLRDAAQDRFDIIEKAFIAGQIGEEEFARLAEENTKKLNAQLEALKDGIAELDPFTQAAAESIQNELSNALVAGFDGGSDDILERWGDLLKRMVADAVAADLTRALFGQTAGDSDFGTAQLVTGIGNLFAGFFDAGGNIPAGQFGIVGEYGPELVSGPATITGRKDTADMLGGSSVSIGQMVFPGITNAREAELAAGAAGRRISRIIAGSQRYN